MPAAIAIDGAIAQILLGLIVVLFATELIIVWQRALGAFFDGVPVIGGYIAQNIVPQVVRMANAVNQWAEVGLTPLTRVIQSADDRLRTAFSQVEGTSARALLGLLHVIQVVVPLAASQAGQYALSLYNLLRGEVLSLSAQAAAALGAAVASLIVRINGVAAAAQAYANQIAGQAYAYAATLYNQAIAYVDSTAVNLRAAFGAGLAVEHVYADQVGATARTYADGVGITDRHYSDIGNATTLAAATTLISGVAARVNTIENSSCMKACAPLGALGQALELIDLAALAVFIAEAAQDPKGTAKALEHDLGPVVQEGRQIGKALFGK